MTVQTTPHLNFRGDARAALEFYRDATGGDLVLISYADAQNVHNPDEADWIMWGQVSTPAGFQVMAYDVPSGTGYDPGEIPVFVSVRGDDTAEIQALWDRLADGADVKAPIAPSFFAPLYGMLRDRFGVTWVLDVQAARGA